MIIRWREVAWLRGQQPHDNHPPPKEPNCATAHPIYTDMCTNQKMVGGRYAAGVGGRAVPLACDMTVEGVLCVVGAVGYC